MRCTPVASGRRRLNEYRKVLESIPGVDPPEDKILKVKEEVEWLQGKLHAFTFTLFDEYWSTHSLKDKTIS